MALVLAVIAPAIAAMSRLPEAGSASTNTALAPVNSTAWALATCVCAGTITSSPSPSPSVNHTRCIPAVHEDTVTACGARVYAANSFSNAVARGPWTRIGPASTSITAARSSSSMMGLPNGRLRFATEDFVINVSVDCTVGSPGHPQCHARSRISGSLAHCCIEARYRSPGESPQTGRRQRCRPHHLGGGNGLGVHQHAHLAAEQIEQDCDAIAIRHAVIQPQQVGKDAFKHANLLAHVQVQPLIELDEAGAVFAALKAVHNLAGNRQGLIIGPEQGRDADGRVDGAPALHANIDRNKQVTGEQRPRHDLNATGMPPALKITREICRKSLSPELPNSLVLGIRLSLHDIPARTSGYHFAFPFFCCMRTRNRSGTSTRSTPKRFTAPSQVSRGFSRSATKTASNGSATASKSAKTGSPMNSALAAPFCTMPTILTPCSIAQSDAISAR